jgi:hypothetical protein
VAQTETAGSLPALLFRPCGQLVPDSELLRIVGSTLEGFYLLLLSEDLGDGTDYRGVRVVNPFASPATR